MTAIEIVKSFKGCNKYNLCAGCPIKDERKKTGSACTDVMIKVCKESFESFENLESDNDKLRKIINILCDTISQLIE